MTELYETTWKSVMRLRQTAHQAAHGADSLEDKLRMHRLEKSLGEIERQFKLMRFEVEDAEAFASKTTRCGECGAVVKVG